MDMEYEVSGIIEFYPTTKLKLGTTIEFNSPAGNRIVLSSTHDNDLAVEITLEAGIDTDAKEIAEIELERIYYLLSFFHDIPVMESRVTGMVIVMVTPEGKYVRTAETMIGLDAVLSCVKGFAPESTGKLIYDLEKEYPPDFGDIISMWREAISTKTPALKYLLLYRLMEFLFGRDTRELTSWIKGREPSVQLFSDRQRGEHTFIRTYEITSIPSRSVSLRRI